MQKDQHCQEWPRRPDRRAGARRRQPHASAGMLLFQPLGRPGRCLGPYSDHGHASAIRGQTETAEEEASGHAAVAGRGAGEGNRFRCRPSATELGGALRGGKEIDGCSTDRESLPLLCGAGPAGGWGDVLGLMTARLISKEERGASARLRGAATRTRWTERGGRAERWGVQRTDRSRACPGGVPGLESGRELRVSLGVGRELGTYSAKGTREGSARSSVTG